MRIIQSFAEFEEGGLYNKDNKKGYLNFYSFLLSYLTLNRYYGHVTMICNESAYNSFIRYIPYDEIIFLENKNDVKFWNIYKIDALKSIKEDVIHVDSDVFIFGEIFHEFIFTNNWDVMVQDIIPLEYHSHFTNGFVGKNENFLHNNGIISRGLYDGRFTSCGTLGLTARSKEKYFEAVDKLYPAMKSKELVAGNSLILEELTLYLVSLMNKFRVLQVLSRDSMTNLGPQQAGNQNKYTHMWFSSKFDKRNVELIKRKIRIEFPHYRKLIDKYEMELVENKI